MNFQVLSDCVTSPTPSQQNNHQQPLVKWLQWLLKDQTVFRFLGVNSTRGIRVWSKFRWVFPSKPDPNHLKEQQRPNSFGESFLREKSSLISNDKEKHGRENVIILLFNGKSKKAWPLILSIKNFEMRKP